MTENKTDETPKVAETAPQADAAPKTETAAPATTEARAEPAKAAAPKPAAAKAAPAKKAPARKAAPAKKPAAVAGKAAPAKAAAPKAAAPKTSARKAASPKPTAAKKPATAAKAAPKQAAATAEAVAGTFQPDMFAALRESIGIVVETNRTAVETAMELQETTTSFVQSRLAANAAVVDRIGSAADLTEIADLQREYAETAFEAWSTHFGVVSTTYQDILARGVELATQRVNAASEQLRKSSWF